MSEHDPTDTHEEEQRTAAAQTDAERELAFEVSDLCWLMGSKRGRRVMWRLLSHAGVYRLSYVQGDVFETAFREGNRNQGQRLLSLIMSNASEDYALMVQERSNGR